RWRGSSAVRGGRPVCSPPPLLPTMIPIQHMRVKTSARARSGSAGFATPRRPGRMKPSAAPTAPRRTLAMTLLFTDPTYLKHDTGRHPETADRLRAVTARLEKTGLIERCTPGASRPLTEDEVARVHEPELIRQVKELAEAGGGRIDADT